MEWVEIYQRVLVVFGDVNFEFTHVINSFCQMNKGTVCLEHSLKWMKVPKYNVMMIKREGEFKLLTNWLLSCSQSDLNLLIMVLRVHRKKLPLSWFGRMATYYRFS